MSADLKCPNCSSENVQSVKVAHQIGKSSVNVSGGSLGWGRNSGFTLGSHKLSGTQQNEFSQSIAPPKSPDEVFTTKVSCLGLIVIVVFTAMLSTAAKLEDNTATTLGVIFIFTFLIGQALSYSSYKKKYTRELAKWERNFICLRCGHIYTP